MVLGQGWFAVLEQHFMTDPGCEHVIDFLEPGKLGFKIMYSPLKSAYFRSHAGIWPANMAKQSLRHCLRSSTLSDQSGRAREIARIASGCAQVTCSWSHLKCHPVKLTFPQFRGR